MTKQTDEELVAQAVLQIMLILPDLEQVHRNHAWARKCEHKDMTIWVDPDKFYIIHRLQHNSKGPLEEMIPRIVRYLDNE